MANNRRTIETSTTTGSDKPARRAAAAPKTRSNGSGDLLIGEKRFPNSPPGCQLEAVHV